MEGQSPATATRSPEDKGILLPGSGYKSRLTELN